jgi:sensor histidine kinase regulating citrate/malate metabolism
VRKIAEKFRARFKGLYWRTLFVTVGMVLLTLTLLGASFFSLSYNYARQQRTGDLEGKARVVASFSAGYLEKNAFSTEEEFQQLTSFAASVSDVDFLICDTAGQVLLTTDQALVGQAVAVPADLAADTLNDGLSSVRSNLGGLYASKRFIVGVPVLLADQGKPVGLVFAVAATTALDNMWQAFVGLFFH